MEKNSWLRSNGFRIGLFLGLAHLILMCFLVDSIRRSVPLAQWQLQWVLPGHIDYPITFLIHPLESICPDSLLADLPFPYTEFDFIVPAFVFVILGSIWYFSLPILIEKITDKIAKTKSAKIITALLLLSPIFLSWIELYGFYSLTSNFDLIAMCSLIVFWFIAFIWLYFYKDEKCAVWLLCLVPVLLFNITKHIYWIIK